jgi:hypothetical protein
MFLTVALFIFPNGNRIIFLLNTDFDTSESFFFFVIFDESDWQFEKRNMQEEMMMMGNLMFIF